MTAYLHTEFEQRTPSGFLLLLIIVLLLPSTFHLTWSAEKISFGKTEQVQSVREGRDAMVNCFVEGMPAPEVSWLYNGEYINSKWHFDPSTRLHYNQL